MTGRPDVATAGEATLSVRTLGCRLNSFESEVMRNLAAEAGLADTVIVNSCAVTSEAERQTRQTIRRARREHPHARIVVTGCAAQIHPDRYAALDEVDVVLGNQEKLRRESFAALADGRQTQRVRVADIQAAEAPETHAVDGIAGRARAFVQVQTGCDHRCTFCIIPHGRGRSRSLAPDRIAAQLQRLVDNGCREAVLSGVDITSYGADLPGAPRLGAMVAETLAAVPDLPRLRLTSLDPAAVDPVLLELIGDAPRLMPHFHLSVQAGDDLVLKRMRRRHDRRQVIDLVAAIRRRRPDAVFGADLIAGFPTETDAMHAATEALVDEAGLTYLHVFPYSPRHGTPAARMPMVPHALRRERAARLRALGARRLSAYLESQVGGHAEILVESATRGRTRHFADVEVSGAVRPGELAHVAIDGSTETALLGRAA